MRWHGPPPSWGPQRPGHRAVGAAPQHHAPRPRPAPPRTRHRTPPVSQREERRRVTSGPATGTSHRERRPAAPGSSRQFPAPLDSSDISSARWGHRHGPLPTQGIEATLMASAAVSKPLPLAFPLTAALSRCQDAQPHGARRGGPDRSTPGSATDIPAHDRPTASPPHPTPREKRPRSTRPHAFGHRDRVVPARVRSLRSRCTYGLPRTPMHSRYGVWKASATSSGNGVRAPHPALTRFRSRHLWWEIPTHPTPARVAHARRSSPRHRVANGSPGAKCGENSATPYLHSHSPHSTTGQLCGDRNPSAYGPKVADQRAINRLRPTT